jgi:hypothetical protein
MYRVNIAPSRIQDAINEASNGDTVPLPNKIIPELKEHLEHVKNLYKKNLNTGYSGTFIFGDIENKYKNCARELIWQWFFPAKTLTFTSEKKEHRRYQLHGSHVQKAIKKAVARAKIIKHATGLKPAIYILSPNQRTQG